MTRLNTKHYIRSIVVLVAAISLVNFHRRPFNFRPISQFTSTLTPSRLIQSLLYILHTSPTEGAPPYSIKSPFLVVSRTKPQRRFCSACQRLFGGGATFARAGQLASRSVHRRRAEDLTDALSLPCTIYHLAWKTFINPVDSLSFATAEPMWANHTVLNEADEVLDEAHKVTIDTKFELGVHLPLSSN